jgi:hypothetical protein
LVGDDDADLGEPAAANRLMKAIERVTPIRASIPPISAARRGLPTSPPAWSRRFFGAND